MMVKGGRKMNKSNSKYFSTALRMNEALISLLEKKDMEYISVKEICEKAGVNRSTFYLHYETISDLIAETTETVNNRFMTYFSENKTDVLEKLDQQELSNLILITKEYLFPYLRFIRDNQRIYRAAFRNPAGMQSHIRFNNLQKYVLSPILRRFGISAEYQKYYIAYYIDGITAIIKEWLNQECADDIEQIADIIERCVRPKECGYDG